MHILCQALFVPSPHYKKQSIKVHAMCTLAHNSAQNAHFLQTEQRKMEKNLYTPLPRDTHGNAFSPFFSVQPSSSDEVTSCHCCRPVIVFFLFSLCTCRFCCGFGGKSQQKQQPLCLLWILISPLKSMWDSGSKYMTLTCCGFQICCAEQFMCRFCLDFFPKYVNEIFFKSYTRCCYCNTVIYFRISARECTAKNPPSVSIP